MNSQCAAWRLLAQEQATEIIDRVLSHAMSKDDPKLLEGLPLIQKERKGIAFEREGCNADSGRFQARSHLWFLYSSCETFY